VIRPLAPFRPRKEQPATPLPGFKLAHPVLSADGRRVGFTGVTLGRGSVYGIAADADCAQGGRHASPSRWCDCGFYCLHDADDARTLSLDPDYRHTVLLEVLASGRFLRFERGLRYARQRVTAVRIGRCGCGRPATAFIRDAFVPPGWHRLRGACPGCAGQRPVILFSEFARLLGGPPVTPDHDSLPRAPAARGGTAAPDEVAAPAPAGSPAAADGPGFDHADRAALVPLLSAEVALLQARLDEVQRQLARLTGG
jgi:hypothetical protein